MSPERYGSGWQTRACGSRRCRGERAQDFLVEQRLLVGTAEYFEKSHVLKREYEDDTHPFGWMQDGVFDLFDDEDRPYRWHAEEELLEAADELP